jgi:hypothetical protein
VKQKRVRKDGKPWHNNIGLWQAALTTEERIQLTQKSASAQWGSEKEIPKKADDGPWVWPLELGRYDQSSALILLEADMLTRYAEAYRFYRYGRTMDFGLSLNRLVQPLNDTLDYESRGGVFAAKRAWFSCGSELYGFAVPTMLKFCENAKL